MRTHVLYWLLLAAPCLAGTPEGTGRIDFHGYTDCVALENANCRVVLGHHAGGRVLEYAWKGANVLPLNPKMAGKLWDPKTDAYWEPDGGRCDIGPENAIPRHQLLWRGPWTAEITGPRAARMTSAKDAATGVQLVRDFQLDAATSHVRFTQTIRNVSEATKHWCHWSRTFALGSGIVVIPVGAVERFPLHYIRYGPGPVMDFRPEDANVTVRDGCLLITGTPVQPKLGMDSHVGWLAYVMKNDLMFVKRFPTYPARAYSEMAALTISIWYYKDEVCELEPIGPRNDIPPGGSAAYTEAWWILPRAYPTPPQSLDVPAVKAQVAAQAR
ncbi:hypothetical protein HQ560_09310 [bacterium]|nr:hypothetical protein [bacterium]